VRSYPSCLRAEWGECSIERKGYRNGSYTRNLATTSGQIEDLEVRRRSRRGVSYPDRMTRYNRYEQQVADGLPQMFVSGTSTQKVGEVAQTLMGVAPSASSVSRLNRSLTEQFEEWRERNLQDHWRILSLDGIHFEVRNARSGGFHDHCSRVRSRLRREQRYSRNACLL
jgi:putative transposase